MIKINLGCFIDFVTSFNLLLIDRFTNRSCKFDTNYEPHNLFSDFIEIKENQLLFTRDLLRLFNKLAESPVTVASSQFEH